MKLFRISNLYTLKKKICYIHVAKCGGTSISSAIKERYSIKDRFLRNNAFINLNAGPSLKSAQILNEGLWAYREKLLIYFLSQGHCTFVSGHFPFSDLAMKHFGDEYDFITIIRHPVERWFSHYFFNRYKKSDHYKTTLSLEEYIDSEDGRSLGSFYHTLFYGKCDEEMGNFNESYLKIISNFDKFACIGVTEHMDIFCRDFNRYFGVEINIERKNKNPLNKNDRSKLITETIRKKVEKICEPDLKIYNYVLEKILSP